MPKTKTTVNDIILLAKKTFGEDIIVLPEMGGSLVNETVECISTGHPAIDKALGIQGLPRGRIVEIMGMEGGGKTTLALHVIKEAQLLGLNCALIDTEHAIDRERTEAIGVDFQKLAISQPGHAEEALELLDFLTRSGMFGVIVVDSVAALSPKAEIEGEMSDSTIGLQARLMSKILRKIVGTANKTKTMIIFTNQLRAKIGGFSFIPQEVGSGGNALKFYASVRIDIRRTKNNKSGEHLTSTEHKVVIKKNKMAVPMEMAIVKIGKKGWVIFDET